MNFVARNFRGFRCGQSQRPPWRKNAWILAGMADLWGVLIPGVGFIVQLLSGVALAIGNGAPNRRSIVSVSRRYTDI
mgnify:CR=1 FL=1